MKYKIDYVISTHSDPKKLQHGMKKSVVLDLPNSNAKLDYAHQRIKVRTPSGMHYMIVSMTPVEDKKKVGNTTVKSNTVTRKRNKVYSNEKESFSSIIIGLIAGNALPIMVIIVVLLLILL